MKFLMCLALFVAAAQAGVVAPISTYSAIAPGFTTYAAAAPSFPSHYTTYSAPAPAYTSIYNAPAYTRYVAAAPALTSSVYGAAPVVYNSPVATYSTLLKK